MPASYPGSLFRANFVRFRRTDDNFTNIGINIEIIHLKIYISPQETPILGIRFPDSGTRKPIP